MARNILIPIEISSRELAPKLFMANKFCMSGDVCYVGEKSNIYSLSSHLSPSIYIDKGYHVGVSNKLFDYLKSNGVKIVSLDEENAIDFEDFQTIRCRFPQEALNEFDKIFLWGKIQYEFLKSIRDNTWQKKAYILGHPRFDLLKEKFHYLYDVEVRRYKSEYGKFILVNTNFGFGNNILSEEGVIQNYGSRVPQTKDMIAYQKIQMNNFVELCVRLGKIDNLSVVLRPHPEEDQTFYFERLGGYDNIHIVKEGSVIPWLLASETMIHHDCTPAIEAAMLGKSSISYNKDINHSLTTPLPLRISYSYSKLSDIVNNIESKEYMKKLIDNTILDDYFSFGVGSSTDAIVEAVNKMELSTNTSKGNLNLFWLVSNIKSLLRKLFNRESSLFRDKINGLNYDNIVSILKEYEKGGNGKIRVEKINKYLYRLSAHEA